VPVDYSLSVISEDPDDDMVLNTALSGKADYIVSGDKHMLTSKKYKSVKILKISEVLELLQSN
jgi:uncharacterized protein